MLAPENVEAISDLQVVLGKSDVNVAGHRSRDVEPLLHFQQGKGEPTSRKSRRFSHTENMIML